MIGKVFFDRDVSKVLLSLGVAAVFNVQAALSQESSPPIGEVQEQIEAGLRTRPQRDLTTHHCHGSHQHAGVSERMEYDMGPSIARSDSFDVHHYHLKLDVTDYSGQSIQAEAQIRFSTSEDGAENLWWDLIDDLQVDSVKLDGDSIGFFHAANELNIEMPEGGWDVGVGERELQVFYRGQPGTDPYWGGFYFASDYIYNLGIGLTSMPPHHGKVWYPCFDQFIERASYTYEVTSAGGRSLHGQGALIQTDSLGGDTIRRTFELLHEIPTHLSAIAVADYSDFDTTYTGVYGPNPARLTAKPAQLASMKTRFSDLPAAVDALEHWWGPQAWPRVGYVITTKGAMEHPTNIAYPLSMLSESNFQNEGLYSHELGHHWWGNQVAPRVHNHMWIKEGFAEYSSHLFEEWLHGPEALVDMVKDNQLFVLEQAHIDDGGFFALSPIPDDNIYGRHSYNKGASVVHNLRNFLGDEVFQQATQEVIAAHDGGTLDAEALDEALTAASGVDCTPWFDAHIYQPGFSSWVIDSTSTFAGLTGYETTLYIQQKLRACENHHEAEPLDVTIWNASGEREELQIVASGAFDEITILHQNAPEMIALNANGRLNQARMDLTYVIDGTTSLFNLPWVAMRIGCDEMAEGDSAIMRVEHHWTAPDAGPTADYFDEISSTHFWVIDGLWPEGAVFDARINYVGNDTDDLDFDLYGMTEALAFLAWRPSAAEPWVEFPDYTIQMGNETNGTGIFKISALRKGQFCFANGDVSVGLAELNGDDNGDGLSAQATVFPSPASAFVNLSCPSCISALGAATVQIHDAAGRLVWSGSPSDSEQRINLTGWASGMYTAVWSDAERRLAQASFAVR